MVPLVQDSLVLWISGISEMLSHIRHIVVELSILFCQVHLLKEKILKNTVTHMKKKKEHPFRKMDSF